MAAASPNHIVSSHFPYVSRADSKKKKFISQRFNSCTGTLRQTETARGGPERKWREAVSGAQRRALTPVLVAHGCLIFGAVVLAGRGRWRRRWREVEALEVRRGAAGPGPSTSPLALRLGRRHARRQNPSSSRQPWPAEAALIRHRSRPGRQSRPSTRRLSMR